MATLNKGDVVLVENPTYLTMLQIVAGFEARCEGVEITDDFTVNTLDKDYYGVYYGYAALPMPPETVYYLTNDAIDGARVYHKNVVGSPIFSIPCLGYLSNWLQTREGMIMGGAIALVILILTFMPDLLNAVDDTPKKKKRKKKKKKPVQE